MTRGSEQLGKEGVSLALPTGNRAYPVPLVNTGEPG